MQEYLAFREYIEKLNAMRAFFFSHLFSYFSHLFYGLGLNIMIMGLHELIKHLVGEKNWCVIQTELQSKTKVVKPLKMKFCYCLILNKHQI